MPRDCTCSLHVSRIGKGVKSADLRDAFEKYGKIKDVYIPLDYYTKDSRGFGYVEFYEREDAEAAYDRRRDILIRRKPATIEFARGQRKTSREMRVNERYVDAVVGFGWYLGLLEWILQSAAWPAPFTEPAAPAPQP
ncbi:hypothetical protein H4S01_004661 [Coemansia sp. RSA 2610]|nr:hypothetical protein H4S01_004661 [Coemansia sp. RSA 2610]